MRSNIALPLSEETKETFFKQLAKTLVSVKYLLRPARTKKQKSKNHVYKT